MKVYVLVNKDREDPSVLGVYASEECAEEGKMEWISRGRPYVYFPEELYIEEFILQ